MNTINNVAGRMAYRLSHPPRRASSPACGRPTCHPEILVGIERVQQRSITAEKVAINAVMAGMPAHVSAGSGGHPARHVPRAL